MCYEMRWSLIDDVVEDIIDRRGVTPLKLGGDFVSAGHRVISAKLVKQGRVNFDADEARFVDEAIYRKWMKSPLREGDVLMTSEAPLGELAYIERDCDWVLGQRLFSIRPNRELLDGLFLYYALQIEQVRADILGRATGTTVQGIRQSELRRVRIPVPSLRTQKAISSILGALDSRVSLLRETSVTLEAIAKTLFKSWFVDFDPVRAKSQERQPEGIDAETADIFPSEFDNSDLGLIPKGWSTISVYEMAVFINGASYKAFSPNSDRRGMPIIKIAELKAGVTEQTAYSDLLLPDKYRIQTGDILFSWSGNPDTSIDTFVWAHNEAWLNQHIFRVLPHSESERSFLLQTLRSLRPVFAELARNKQTTGLGHVTVADMRRLKVVRPSKAVLDKFDQLASVIHQKVLANEKQAIALTHLRDTLLPRLISGQLRLSEAEDHVQEVLA